MVIYITIRNMANFLASAYCEYLRWNKYIDFCDYTKHFSPQDASWFDVFQRLIIDNPNIEFKVFNFEGFKKDKPKLIESISFGKITNFNENIQPSRQKFSQSELTLISGCQVSDNKKNNSFQPFEADIVQLCNEKLNQDLLLFRQLPNVKIINDVE